MRRPTTITIPDPDHGCWPLAELTRFTAQLGAIDPTHDGSVVIRSDGDDFCRGVDLALFVGDLPTLERALRDAFVALANCPVPILASVRGAVSGFGLTMLAHASFVAAAPNAVFSAPFLSLGLAPEAGSTLLLPERIGPLAAFRLLCTGDQMNAQDALTVGLISKIDDSPDPEALRIARRLSRIDAGLLKETRRLMKETDVNIETRIKAELTISRTRLQENEHMSSTFKRLARIADTSARLAS